MVNVGADAGALQVWEAHHGALASPSSSEVEEPHPNHGRLSPVSNPRPPLCSCWNVDAVAHSLLPPPASRTLPPPPGARIGNISSADYTSTNRGRGNDTGPGPLLQEVLRL